MAFKLSGDDDYQKALFIKLLSEGSSAAPVQHWTQGLARVAQALSGAYGLKDLKDKDETSRNKMAEILFGGSLGETTSTPSTTPSTAPSTAMADALQPKTSRPPMAPDDDAVTEAKTPQDYINRAWGGLTPQGRDVATRTVLGEAANQGGMPQPPVFNGDISKMSPAERSALGAEAFKKVASQSPGGMAPVADVIRNRAVKGGYGGNTMDQVAQAKGQFEPWMTPEGRAKMAAYPQQGKPYQEAQAAVDTAAIGSRPDVTGGAVNFYSPGEQKKLAAVDGRAVTPAWAQGREPSAVIGGHNFYGPQTRTAQAGGQPLQAGIPNISPQVAQQALSQVPPEVAQKLRQLWNAGPQGRAMALQMYQQYNKPKEPPTSVQEFEYGRRNPEFARRQEELKRAGATSVNVDTKPFPVEVQQKLNLAQTGLAAIRESRKVLEGDWDAKKIGQWGAHQAGIGAASGELGRALGDVQFAVENAMHIATGAAAPNQEVARKAKYFTPTPTDDAAARKRKLDRLNAFLSNAVTLAQQGRTVPPSQIDSLIPSDTQDSGSQGGGNILDEAREAIKRGVPRDAVMKRLQERGVQVPAGF